MKKWIKKKNDYKKENFSEGENLFVTIDEKDGSIDSSHVLTIAKKIKQITEKV
jgi:hypothetical protein